MKNVDIIITARWIIPVIPKKKVLKNHALVINDGKIVDLLAQKEALLKYKAVQQITCESHVLLPGFINAHTHAAMTLFRGIADDLPLMEWLSKHIWPAEQKWVSPDFIRDGSRLAIAEMLNSGTTCFNDMYFFPDITAKVAIEAGIRAVIGLIVLDFPTVWASNADEYIHKGVNLYDEYNNSSHIFTAFAPHAPYTVSDEPLKNIRMYADELDIPVHIHLHETRDEVNDALSITGLRPFSRLDALGLINSNLLAVHMTRLKDEEIERLAEAGGSVVHCPTSNLKLASGICPAQCLLDKGINVALGTDSAASNNTLDMLAEIHQAALVGKIADYNPKGIDAVTALEMATINGAKALGIADKFGSLEVGKEADVIAVDLDDINTSPLFDPISHLVYAANRSQVSDVWVGGKAVKRNGGLLVFDDGELIAMAQQWGEKLNNYED